MSGHAAGRGFKVLPTIADNLNAGVFSSEKEEMAHQQRENPLESLILRR